MNKENKYLSEGIKLVSMIIIGSFMVEALDLKSLLPPLTRYIIVVAFNLLVYFSLGSKIDKLILKQREVAK